MTQGNLITYFTTSRDRNIYYCISSILQSWGPGIVSVLYCLKKTGIVHPSWTPFQTQYMSHDDSPSRSSDAKSVTSTADSIIQNHATPTRQDEACSLLRSKAWIQYSHLGRGPGLCGNNAALNPTNKLLPGTWLKTPVFTMVPLVTKKLNIRELALPQMTPIWRDYCPCMTLTCHDGT